MSRSLLQLKSNCLVRKVFVILVFSILTGAVFGQKEHSLHIPKLEGEPTIDGSLDDTFWEDAAVADNFVQFSPYSGHSPAFQSQVYIAYTNDAIYVGARLYDNAPDSILTEIGKRDYIHDSNAELFGVLLNPFDDDINMVEFMVSSAGVQTDMKHTGDDSDINWNAVWHSEVKTDEQGWIAEIEIPYSALRFPNKLGNPWGVHFFRRNRRYREWSSWVTIDNTIDEFVSQSGKLTGIKDIDPPFRLSFTPYLSGYLEEAEGVWGSDLRGGMDLKYGINQSFTLDMTLIPDFGQVKSDDKILNLSPFEVRYDEKRPFFTEGTELFSKGNIFYSRRIGDRPRFSNEAEDQLEENEVITKQPATTQMINATKVSGRTSSGLGIGFFNAMTSESITEIEDTITGATRNFVSQGFTNYNMVVFDQNLANNSYASLANTNVYYNNRGKAANVTAADMAFSNKDNSYRVTARGALSQVAYSDDPTGFAYYLNFGKTKGKFKFNYSHAVESDTYNPNDMGFLRQNNEWAHAIRLEYQEKEPFGKFMNWNSRFSVRYASLYKPRKFNEVELSFSSNTTLQKSYFHIGMFALYKPAEVNDFYEAREEGQVFKRPRIMFFNTWFSTDYRKSLALDGNTGYKQSEWDNHYAYWLRIGPRWRVGDKFNMSINYSIDNERNDIGYATKDEINNQDEIVFGRRDINTYNTVFEANYLVNNKLSLSLRNRYYWRSVEFSEFYVLQNDGYLGEQIPYETYGQENNINYNAFTIDAQLLWHFAPGSELSLVWKNQIYTSDTEIGKNYFSNLDYTLSHDQINSISLKFLYYLDFLYLKRRIMS